MASAMLLALATGGLLALSFPAPGLWPLAFVAYVPLLLALDGASPLRAAGLGWIAHAAVNLLVFRFLWVPLRGLGSLSWPVAVAALVLLAALQGLRGASLGLGVAILGRRLPLPSAFLVAHLAAESVPVLFAWSLSAAAPQLLPLAQSASLGGAPLVALWIAATSLIPATLVARRAGRPWPLRWAWGPLVGLTLALVWGGARLERFLRQEQAEETWPLGLVHGAIPLDPGGSPEIEGWLALVQAARSLERQGARLLLLPETAMPLPVRRGRLQEETRAQFLTRPGVPMVVGALVEGPAGSINGALLVGEERVEEAAGKRELLPFGEYIPMERWLPWLRSFSPRTARLVVMNEDVETRVEGRLLGFSICYEGMLPERVRAAARQGEASLLLNLTNDAWFPGTSEPALHGAHTRLRAVELGRYLVRSTNQGHTMVVAPSGRLLAEATGAPTRPLLTRVAWREERTPFARWGGLPAWGVVLGLLGLLGRGQGLWHRCQGGAPGDGAKEAQRENLGSGMFSARHPGSVGTRPGLTSQ